MDDQYDNWAEHPLPFRHRIHIFGPSGAGTSTLGRMLAGRLESQHFDTDDFYWEPSDPPFRRKRSVRERRDLMERVFLPRSDWVLSGSLDGWSDGIADRFTAAVFLTVDAETLQQRLLARERRRYGASMEPGGAFHEECQAFINWASGYDRGARPGRSRARHEAWMRTLTCPVLKLDALAPPEELANRILMQVSLA